MRHGRARVHPAGGGSVAVGGHVSAREVGVAVLAAHHLGQGSEAEVGAGTSSRDKQRPAPDPRRQPGHAGRTIKVAQSTLFRPPQKRGSIAARPLAAPHGLTGDRTGTRMSSVAEDMQTAIGTALTEIHEDGDQDDAEANSSSNNNNNKLAAEAALDEECAELGSTQMFQPGERIQFTVRPGDNATVMELLGAGAFGEVYKVRRRGKLRACKVVKREDAASSGQQREQRNLAMRDMCDEAILSLGLGQHRNLSCVYEVVESLVSHVGEAFIMMDLLDDGAHTLTDALDKDSPFSVLQHPRYPDLAQSLWQQLLCGLDWLHSNLVLHQDVKPDNLILDRTGVLKITDFGLSATGDVDADTAEFVAPLHGCTKLWASPEVMQVVERLENDPDSADQCLAGVLVTPRTHDLWAAALVGIQLFTQKNMTSPSAMLTADQFASMTDISAFNTEQLIEWMKGFPARAKPPEAFMQHMRANGTTPHDVSQWHLLSRAQVDPEKTIKRLTSFKKMVAHIASSVHCVAVPHSVVTCIQAMMHPDPDQRPPTVRDVLACAGLQHTIAMDLKGTGGVRNGEDALDAARVGSCECKSSDKAAALQTVGTLLHTMGDHRNALEMYSDALALQELWCEEVVEARSGGGGPTPASTQNGDEDEAMDENSVQVCIAVTQANIANVCRAMGNPELALENFEKALALMREYGDEESNSHLAAIMDSIASVKAVQGRAQEALQLYEQALAIEERSPDVNVNGLMRANTLSNLAILYQREFGDTDKALTLYQQSLQLRTSLLKNPEHPDLANANLNIASVYKEQGQHEKALAMYKRAEEIYRASRGDMHPDVALALNNQGIVRKALGDSESALQLFTAALEIQKSALPRAHPEISTTLFNIAVTAGEQGQHQRASAFLREVLDLRRQHFGTADEDNVAICKTLHQLGRSLVKLYNWGAATEVLQEAFERRSRHVAFTHPDIVQTLEDLAVAQLGSENYNAALETYRRVYTIQTKAFKHQQGNSREQPQGGRPVAQRHVVTVVVTQDDRARTVSRIASCYSRLGDKARARGYLAEALKLQNEEPQQPLSPEEVVAHRLAIAQTQCDIAELYRELEGGAVVAAEHLEEAVTTRSECLGEGNPLVGATWAALASVQKKTPGMEEAAIVSYGHALACYTHDCHDNDTGGDGDLRRRTADTLFQLGVLHAHRAELADAIGYMTNAERLYCTVYGREHKDTKLAGRHAAKLTESLQELTELRNQAGKAADTDASAGGEEPNTAPSSWGIRDLLRRNRQVQVHPL